MAMQAPTARRDQLVQAAARLFSEKGFHATSMADLAGSLGILRGSLYAHIESKDDLLFDIVDHGADRFITRIEEVIASDLDPQAKLRAAISAHITTVAEHLEAATVFLNEWKHLSEERREIILGKRDLYAELLSEVIEEGVEWGIYPETLDIPLATLFVLSVLNWTYQWYRVDGGLSPEELAGSISAMVLGGLKSPATDGGVVT